MLAKSQIKAFIQYDMILDESSIYFGPQTFSNKAIYLAYAEFNIPHQR